MRDVTSSNFGILIAYVLPGFTILWGASQYSETLRSWLAADPTGSPTVGGFLYVTLGSVAAGMTVSTVRWLLVDGLHNLTGLKEPPWDFSQLGNKVAAFDVLIRIHYQVYQFNSNMLVAILFAYIMRKAVRGTGGGVIDWEDVAWLVTMVVFFAGSRDTLKRYYVRGQHLLGNREQQNG